MLQLSESFWATLHWLSRVHLWKVVWPDRMGFSVFLNALPPLFHKSCGPQKAKPIQVSFLLECIRWTLQSTRTCCQKVCQIRCNSTLWSNNLSFESTARQTLSISVGQIIPFESSGFISRIEESLLSLCDPKFHLICSRLQIPAYAAKRRIMLHLPGMLACAATSMRAGHSSSDCTFLPFCSFLHAPRQHLKTQLIAWLQLTSCYAFLLCFSFLRASIGCQMFIYDT